MRNEGLAFVYSLALFLAQGDASLLIAKYTVYIYKLKYSIYFSSYTIGIYELEKGF